jgi:branched-chain amino acid transport system permease protein
MFVGAALAGVAGALTAPLVAPTPFMGHSVIVTAFIIIIVGGIGQLEGAVVAAILYAFVHTFVTTFWDGVIADIVGLMLMLLVLMSSPPACSEPGNVPERASTGRLAVRGRAAASPRR